jgi:hypothetical protein
MHDAEADDARETDVVADDELPAGAPEDDVLRVVVVLAVVHSAADCLARAGR